MKKYEELGFDFIDKDAVDPGPDSIIGPGYDYGKVTDKIGNVVLLPLKKTPRQFFIGITVAFCVMQLLLLGMCFLFFVGVGVWGVMIPVAWGFAIVNFVWWIGIGHAGTLISAILLLLKQDWRTSINRFAEAMTLFAVMQAGMFPILHLGRPWLAYWLFPYPNSMWLWPQPRSPLVWDVFAVSTYFTVSLIFWYTGLVPDLATMRDKAIRPWQKKLFGIFALGWRGASRHWSRFSMAYLLLGGLATPLVLSVHTVVSFDFAISSDPGLAHHVLPAVLRRWSDLFGIRDGDHAGHSGTEVVPSGRPDHDAAPGLLREGDAGYGIDRFLCLHHGSVSWRTTAATPMNGSCS